MGQSGNMKVRMKNIWKKKMQWSKKKMGSMKNILQKNIGIKKSDQSGESKKYTIRK